MIDHYCTFVGWSMTFWKMKSFSGFADKFYEHSWAPEPKISSPCRCKWRKLQVRLKPERIGWFPVTFNGWTGVVRILQIVSRWEVCGLLSRSPSSLPSLQLFAMPQLQVDTSVISKLPMCADVGTIQEDVFLIWLFHQASHMSQHLPQAPRPSLYSMKRCPRLLWSSKTSRILGGLWDAV